MQATNYNKFNILESEENLLQTNVSLLEFHDTIFAIFQTLESNHKSDSTGIGLAIVKKIIETEGGKIQLESQLNRGTTFRFTWLKQSCE